jgi:hypothetical protein
MILPWLQALPVFTGREPEVLGAIAAEIREGGEVHGIGYLGERQAFVVEVVFEYVDGVAVYV